jgi:hypothetical protein
MELIVRNAAHGTSHVRRRPESQANNSTADVAVGGVLEVHLVRITGVSIYSENLLGLFMRLERDQNGRLKLRRTSGAKKIAALAVVALFVGVCGISVVAAADMSGDSAQEQKGIENGDGIPNPDCPDPNPNPDCPNTCQDCLG